MRPTAFLYLLPVTALAALSTPPPLGFGTWQLPADETTTTAVTDAIVRGYRHIDCAAAYGNQEAVGAGIAEGLQRAGLAREDLWITGKLWNDAHAGSGDDGAVRRALEDSVRQLGVGYLDLWLVHWPVAQRGEGVYEEEYEETWRAMAALPAATNNLTRYVGVSNFSPRQLRRLLERFPEAPPFAHQLEAHPYLPQTAFLAFHARRGIHVTAYSPLGNTNPIYGAASERTGSTEAQTEKATTPLLKTEAVREIARKRRCTPAQVAVAWGVARGTSVVVKSRKPERQKENFLAIKGPISPGCELSQEEVKSMARKLPTKRFNNPGASWGVKLFEGLDGVTPTAAEAFSIGVDKTWYWILEAWEDLIQGKYSAWVREKLKLVEDWFNKGVEQKGEL